MSLYIYGLKLDITAKSYRLINIFVTKHKRSDRISFHDLNYYAYSLFNVQQLSQT